MQASAHAFKIIREREGLCLKAYPDPGTGGVPWTIGYGCAIGVHPGQTCTKEQAEAWLERDVGNVAHIVAQLIGAAPTTQSQFDAMVILTYNIGPGNFSHSSVLTNHKLRRYAQAAACFALWDKDNHGTHVERGLVTRRAIEAALYRS